MSALLIVLRLPSVVEMTDDLKNNLVDCCREEGVEGPIPITVHEVPSRAPQLPRRSPEQTREPDRTSTFASEGGVQVLAAFPHVVDPEPDEEL